jgi:hypothetical protein
MKGNTNRGKGRHGVLAYALILALVFSLSIPISAAGSVYNGDNGVDRKSTYPQPYPWSKVSGATGDYIADSYNGIQYGRHVFEDVTEERLEDILTREGYYYFVFGGPELDSTQTILKSINKVARANGVKKIYHFDPRLDGYQIDISDPVDSLQYKFDGFLPSHYEVDGRIHWDLYELWTRLENKLDYSIDISSISPASITPGTPGATLLRNYDSDDTLLFLLKENDRGDNAEPVLVGSYTFKDSQIAAYNASPAAEEARILDLFKEGDPDNSVAGTSSVRAGDISSELAFFRRAWNGNDRWWTGSRPSQLFSSNGTTNYPFSSATPGSILASREGTRGALPTASGGAASIGDYYLQDLFPGFTDDDFPLHQISFHELLNLYNTPGDHNILYASTWCPNSTAIIGEVAKAAKKFNQIVYVYDPTLGGQEIYSTPGAVITLAQGTDRQTTIPGIDYIKVIHSNQQGYFTRNSYGWAKPSNFTGTAGGATIAQLEAYDSRVDFNVPNFKHSYVYGEAVRYLKDFVTENWSKHNTPSDVGASFDGTEGRADLGITGSPRYIQYVPNGDFDPVTGLPDTPATSLAEWEGNNWADGSTVAARRLQVPFFVRYNKDAESPVIREWLQLQRDGTYKEYMLSSATVYRVNGNGTATSNGNDQVDAPGSASSTYDGLSSIEWTAEAIEALENVLNPNIIEHFQHSFRSSAIGTPSISGAAVAGAELTAETGTWRLSPVFTYQWKADGNDIPGAIESTYTLTPGDVGKSITVEVTASRPNYISVTQETAPLGSTVTPNTFDVPAAPAVTGTVKAGEALTVSAGTWDPEPDAITYQWYADGVAISGATGSSYNLKSSDAGKSIAVTVTAEKEGYATQTRTIQVSGIVAKSADAIAAEANAKAIKDLEDKIAELEKANADANAKAIKELQDKVAKLEKNQSTATAAKAFTAAAVPKITGKAKVGKTLKVKVGKWSPVPKFTYQWYAGGKAIKGATKATLKLKKAQKGKKITVKVTGKKAGYITKTKTSKATAKVK